MRLSPARVVLRALLLVVGGTFMAVKARAYYAGARASAEDAALLGGMAAVAALLAVLAYASAYLALRSVRRRSRKHTLRLHDLPPPRRGAD